MTEEDPIEAAVQSLVNDGWRDRDGLWFPPRTLPVRLWEFVPDGSEEIGRQQIRGVSLAQALRLRWVWNTLTRNLKGR